MGDGTRGYTSGGETASTIPLWGTLIGCLTSKINKESPTAHDHPPLSLLVSQTQSVLSPIPHMLYIKRAVSAGYLRDRFSILRLFRFTPLCGSFHCGSRGMYTVQVCFRFWAPCFELASQSHWLSCVLYEFYEDMMLPVPSQEWTNLTCLSKCGFVSPGPLSWNVLVILFGSSRNPFAGKEATCACCITARPATTSTVR